MVNTLKEVVKILSGGNFWLLLGLLAVLIGYALWSGSPFARGVFRKSYLIILAPFIIPVLMLVFAALFPAQEVGPFGWRDATLIALLLLQFGIQIYAFVHMKGFRFFVLAVSVLQTWLTAFAFLAATMRVTAYYLIT